MLTSRRRDVRSDSRPDAKTFDSKTQCMSCRLSAPTHPKLSDGARQVPTPFASLVKPLRLVLPLARWLQKPRHKHQRCSQQDTFTSIIQTTNHPAQVPLAQPNMPVLVPSTPSSEALRKLYFETAKPFFLGYIEEPEEKPTFGGGYSDVYRCPIQFCAPSENLPTEVSLWNISEQLKQDLIAYARSL